MKKFDLGKAFSQPINEKSGIAKVALLLVANIVPVIVAIVGVILFILPIIGAAASSNSRNDAAVALAGLSPIIAIIFCCLFVIIAIVLVTMNLWYSYEYTSAAIEARETKAIWQTDTVEVLKKAGKLFLLTLIINIPYAIFYCVFSFAMNFLQTFISVGLGSSSTSSYNSYYGYGSSMRDTATAGDLSAIVINLFISLCMGLVIFVVQLLYHTYITTPASLRMISTNTFAEGFNFSKNWKWAMTHKGDLAKLMAIQAGLGLLFGVAIFVSYLAVFVLIGIPMLFVLGIVAFYWQYFANNVFVGNFYRAVNKN